MTGYWVSERGYRMKVSFEVGGGFWSCEFTGNSQPFIANESHIRKHYTRCS